MAIISGLMPKFSVGIPFQIQRYNGCRFQSNNLAFRLESKRIFLAQVKYFFQGDSGTKYTLSVGTNHHELRFDDDVPKESFWSTLIKEAFWALKSLLAFLAEQPSQLKYLEWPSFQSTLKTATLTLVLVALLIVALSSVDAALCYLLALLLRRTP